MPAVKALHTSTPLYVSYQPLYYLIITCKVSSLIAFTVVYFGPKSAVKIDNLNIQLNIN